MPAPSTENDRQTAARLSPRHARMPDDRPLPVDGRTPRHARSCDRRTYRHSDGNARADRGHHSDGNARADRWPEISGQTWARLTGYGDDTP